MNSDLYFETTATIISDVEHYVAKTGKEYLQCTIGYQYGGSSFETYTPVIIWLKNNDSNNHTTPSLHEGDVIQVIGHIQEDPWTKSNGDFTIIYRIHCTQAGITLLKKTNIFRRKLKILRYVLLKGKILITNIFN